MANTKKAGTAKKPVEAAPSDLDVQVAEWVAKAPDIRGLRRPGTRMKAAALMQKMDARGLLADDAAVDTAAVEGMADFVADIDELLGVLGGDEYIDFIEQVPMDDGLQVAVLIELFSDRIAPTLGKG